VEDDDNMDLAVTVTAGNAVVFLGGAVNPDAAVLLARWPATVITLASLPTSTGEELGWGKLEAAAGWLDAHPDVSQVLWFDPEMDDLDDLDVPYRELVAEVLDARGVTHDLLAPALVDVAFLAQFASVELQAATALVAPSPARGNRQTFVPTKTDPPRTSSEQGGTPDLARVVPAPALRPAGVTMTAPMPDEW